MARAKGCYCHTCRRSILSLGIARHRAMHKDKREDCVITFSTGETRSYRYSKWLIKIKDPLVLKLPKRRSLK